MGFMIEYQQRGKFMPEYSKFRVITAGFILMFIFVVAAMYSNTKDIAAQKVRNEENNQINYNNSTKPEANTTTLRFDNDNKNSATEDDIDDLTYRVDNLEKLYNALDKEVSTKKTALNCKIRGILDSGEVVPLPVNESLEEARINNRELVITCEIR